MGRGEQPLGERVLDERGRTDFRGLVLVIVLCILLARGACAQQSQTNQAPDAPSASTSSSTPPGHSNRVQSGVAFFQLLQRKSVVFPDIATAQGSLSRGQKFRLAANNSVSVSTVSTALVASTFSLYLDRPPGYGEGIGGYGKRFGADLARSASNNLFGTFLIASVTHEDPRFYVRKDLSFKQSLTYAALRLVRTRSDSGDSVFNYSGLLGTLAGEALADTYYPEGSKGVGSAFIRFSSDLAWRFGGNLLRQYWPKINRRLKLSPIPVR